LISFTTENTCEKSDITLYKGAFKEIFAKGEIKLKVKEISLSIIKFLKSGKISVRKTVAVEGVVQSLPVGLEVV